VLLWLGNVTVGIVAAVMWTLSPGGVLVAAVPVLLSYLACAGWLNTLKERDRMDDLYRAGQVLLERLETEGDFRPFLELVGRMLDATTAEIVIVRGGVVQIHDASGTVSAAPEPATPTNGMTPGGWNRSSTICWTRARSRWASR
jgi:hypothetical protein